MNSGNIISFSAESARGTHSDNNQMTRETLTEEVEMNVKVIELILNEH